MKLLLCLALVVASVARDSDWYVDPVLGSDIHHPVVRDHEVGRNVPDEMVASTTRWIAVDGRLVGFLSIRHELNAFLLELGGHIGYAIRPSERRRGYATAATALALTECRRLGIDPVLITCDDTNLASAKTIERNGGVLEDIRTGKRRYWVSVSERR